MLESCFYLKKKVEIAIVVFLFLREMHDRGEGSRSFRKQRIA